MTERATGWRFPHVLWREKATMIFPRVTRDVTHYGIVWGSWFFGFARGGKQAAALRGVGKKGKRDE